MAKSASNQKTLDQFMSCWEGTQRALHDSHELLLIGELQVLPHLFFVGRAATENFSCCMTPFTR
jgi:hypothetical protein